MSPCRLARLATLCAAASLTGLPPAQAQDSFGGGRAGPAGTTRQAAPTAPTAYTPPRAGPGQAPRPPAVDQGALAPPATPGATAVAAAERQDFGVPAPSQLHAGAMHGPTPVSIPGAQVISTADLAKLLQRQPQDLRVFDVLGGPKRLPQALNAVPAHQAGSFDDATQRQFGQFLQQVTQGRQDLPLVFYCASTQCWMSYNAALRASRMGYRKVLWYRGGVEAWEAAGLPLHGPSGGYAGPGAGAPEAHPGPAGRGGG